MGLKVLKSVYMSSYCGFLSAVTGSGCRSSSSVGAGYFSGRIRWRKDTGRVASHCSHLSLTTWSTQHVGTSQQSAVSSQQSAVSIRYHFGWNLRFPRNQAVVLCNVVDIDL